MTPESTTPEEGARPEKSSILGNIKARREQIATKLYLDLPVPRWTEPAPIIRYGPVPHSYIAAGQDKVEKAPKARRAQVQLDTNIDVLIKAVNDLEEGGVFARVGDAELAFNPDDMDGPWPKFDGVLAMNLGLIESPDEPCTAREIVKALFFTDQDILSHASALGEWVGYRQTEADEYFRGE